MSVQTNFTNFYQFMDNSIKHINVSNFEINKYQDVFKGEKDSHNVIVDLWKRDGLSTYKDGLFSTVNPDTYNDLVRSFNKISNEAIVFAKTFMGNLFLWEKHSFGNTIVHLNIHSGNKTILSSNFKVFFEWNLPSSNYWNRNCYGEFEFLAQKKFGKIEYNECIGYKPTLVLGGEEREENMKIFKHKEHLIILSQIHS